MSKQQIFPGSSPNDGTGDTLYQGALKINSNFNEIYTTFGDGTNLYNVTGPQGAIGPQGAQGSQGSQGFQGSQGSQGSQGFQGSQGSQGSQGLQGPQGAQGNQGSQGIVGPQGAQGLQGIVGPQGSQGVGGPQGFLGPQGSQGFQGVPGSNGSSTHQWTTTPVGIHTLSNVGIGTTNSTSGLTVKGNVSVSGVSTFSNNFNIDNSIIELSHTVAVRSVASGNLTAYFDESGTATLLHENIPRLITTNEGLDILGTASVTNDINVSGLTTTTNLYVSGVSTFIDDIVAYDPYGVALVWDSSQSRLEFASGKVVTFGDSVAPQLEIFNIANSESSIIATGGVPLTIKTSSSASTLGNATTKLSVSGIGITVTGTTFTNQLSVSGITTTARLNVGTGGTVITTTAVGLVGIGTTNPTSALTVKGTTSLETLTVTGGLGGYTDIQGGVITFNSNGSITQTGSQHLHRSSSSGGGSYYFSDYYAATDHKIIYADGGKVELYSSDSKKFETLGVGVTVTGTTFTNQLSVSGVSTFNSTLNGVYLNNAANVKGTSNIAIGQDALLNHTNGDNSIAIGYRALYTASNINFSNIGIGYQAGYLVSNGVLNTFLGYKSGYDMLGGSGNVIIGSFDGNEYGLDIRNADDYIILSANGQTSTQPRLVIDPNGNTGIGTTNPTQKLDVAGSVKVGINTSQGVILTSPNGTKYQLFVENDGTLKTVAV